MNRNLMCLVLLAISATSFDRPASAGYQVRVGDGSVMAYDPGMTVSMDVFLKWEGLFPPEVLSMNLAFDLGVAGDGYESFFSNLQVLNASPAVFSAVQSEGSGDNFDLGVSATNGTPVQIDSQNLMKLFTIKFDVGANAVSGNYKLVFRPDGKLFDDDYNGPGGNAEFGLYQGGGGEFTINSAAAVPEPATLGLLGLCGAGAWGFVKRRRKQLPVAECTPEREVA
jgi:hypothetical protein